jgi:hypothetical protein
MSPPAPDDRPVDRAAIEAKLRELRGEVDSTATAAKPTMIAVAGVAVVVLLGAAYLLGRRKGKKKSTVVEIRRV